MGSGGPSASLVSHCKTEFYPSGPTEIDPARRTRDFCNPNVHLRSGPLAPARVRHASLAPPSRAATGSRHKYRRTGQPCLSLEYGCVGLEWGVEVPLATPSGRGRHAGRTPATLNGALHLRVRAAPASTAPSRPPRAGFASRWVRVRVRVRGYPGRVNLNRASLDCAESPPTCVAGLAAARRRNP